MENTINITAYTLKYMYQNCHEMSFEKMIPAESIEEAIFDAKNWIDEQNNEVASKPKAGNHIDFASIQEGWSTKAIIKDGNVIRA